MIPAQIISDWRIHAPWSDDDDVEQDLILTRTLLSIYSDTFLSEKLAFRGGTCLNKLFWKNPVRYSEDLDFVQIHKEPVGKTITSLREILDPIFEINTREHFATEGHQKRMLSMQSAWHSGECEVTTFSLEELLATKLRAIYQRRKGRDLFDLWKSQELKPDWTRVISIFLKYLELLRKPIYRDLLNDNLQDKIMDPRFQEDTESLIINQKEYDIDKAAEFVKEELYSRVPPSKKRERKKGK